MKYYLEPKAGKDSRHAIVIRGRDKSGKPYRIFLTAAFDDARTKKDNWNQAKQTVSGNPVLKTTLNTIKTKLESRVLEQSLNAKGYDIPDAWRDVYKPLDSASSKHIEDTPETITGLIPIYKATYVNKMAAGYLRIFDQLAADVKRWNKRWEFSNLNELNLIAYEGYLNGKDSQCPRTPLHPASIYNHFKLLKVMAKFAQIKGIKIDPAILSYKIQYVHTEGGFSLNIDELLTLWFYKTSSWIETLSKDLFLFEAFTGIRNGDISRLQNGDVESHAISYRDKKNGQIVKTVTVNKFSQEILSRYKGENPSDKLFPAIAQQTVNSTIKEIAAKAGLNRSIRRGNEFFEVAKILSSHCGQHSYASLLSRIGVPQDYVKAELGHSQGSITFNTYVHRDDRHELVRSLVNKIPMKQGAKEFRLSFDKKSA